MRIRGVTGTAVGCGLDGVENVWRSKPVGGNLKWVCEGKRGRLVGRLQNIKRAVMAEEMSFYSDMNELDQ